MALSAQALAEGGSSDIKIVLREGSAYTVQRVGGKTYDQMRLPKEGIAYYRKALELKPDFEQVLVDVVAFLGG